MTATPSASTAGTRLCPTDRTPEGDTLICGANSTLIMQTAGGVLIRGEALPLLYRACLALIARRHRDGLAAHPLLQEARLAFYRATMSPQRHKDDDHTSPSHAQEARTVT